MKGLVTVFVIALSGCTPTFHSREWATLPANERQRALNEIARKCNLPNNRVAILEGDRVRVTPDANDRYEAVDCLLGGLKSLRGIQLGFVGNEAFTNEVN